MSESLQSSHIKKGKISDLTPDDKNLNKGTPRGEAMLEHSLRDYGAGRSILLDKNNRIIAGNKTAQQAYTIGLDDLLIVETDGKQLVAVKRNDIDLDSKAGRELAIADNRTSEVSLEWDAAALADIAEFADVTKFFDEHEVDAILAELGGSSEPADDPGPQLDRAEELREKWQTERGQLWQIGRHRLLCGDSTSAEDVARLMNNEKAQMMFTDPPYGVDVVGGTRDPRDVKNYRSGNSVVNDALSDEDLEALVCGAFRLAKSVLKPGSSFYVWHPSSKIELFARVVRSELAAHRQVIIWQKENFVFGRQDYHWQHEPCFYGWIDGAPHTWLGSRDQGTLWQVGKVGSELEKKLHPTAKPIGLAEKAILNSLPANAVAYEPFCGAGATVVAAERTNRICCAMEIEPKYVAVTLERLSQMGLEPKRIDHA